MFFNQIDLSKLVRSTRFYVDFSSLNISQPDHVCWCGWILWKKLLSVSVQQDTCLRQCEFVHSPICQKILSTDMWMFSEHCSPECGSYEAPGAEFWLVWLVKRHHP